jgi:hypothetical protein
MITKPLSRRAVLRGTGVAVGLPLLEAMLPRLATAATNPKRFLVAWAGQITYVSSHPAGPLQATMPEMWASLQPIRKHVSFVSALNVPPWNVGLGQKPVPGGCFVATHGNSYGPQLTGVYSTKGGGSIRGETVDHVVSKAIGGAATVFPVVAGITQASNYNGNPVVESYSRQMLGSTLQTFDASRTPTALYSRLFGNYPWPTAGGAPVPAPGPTGPSALLLRKKSVLDVINRGSSGLLGTLSPADRSRVEEHFAGIRKLENSLTALPPSSGATSASCMKFAAPMAETPPTSHNFGGWANETYRGQVMADIFAMAFACDRTRSILWTITRDQSWLGSYDISGAPPIVSGVGTYPADFHAMGHEVGKSVTIQAAYKNQSWAAGLWGRFVDNLSKIQEGSETVLDNSFTTLMFSEAGGSHGQDRHTIPFAGSPSKLKAGEWFNGAGAHPAQVLISGMKGLGINTNTLGEITSPFAPILR